MKRFNNKQNLVGKYIEETRKAKGITKADLCRKLELIGVEFDRNEIYRIEHNRMSVKDFELIAFAIVLNMDLNKFKDILINDDENKET